MNICTSGIQRGKTWSLTKFVKWNYASVNINIIFICCNSPHFCLWTVTFLSTINNASRAPSKFILHAFIEHEASTVTIKLIINTADAHEILANVKTTDDKLSIIIIIQINRFKILQIITIIDHLVRSGVIGSRGSSVIRTFFFDFSVEKK